MVFINVSTAGTYKENSQDTLSNMEMQATEL